MVDSTLDTVRDEIVLPYLDGLAQCPTTEKMVQLTIATIRDLHRLILTEHFLYLDSVRNPQEHSKERRDAI
jgi:hypothetical protein